MDLLLRHGHTPQSHHPGTRDIAPERLKSLPECENLYILDCHNLRHWMPYPSHQPDSPSIQTKAFYFKFYFF